MTKEITEAELVSLVMERSTYGFSVLYERYASILFDVISKIVSDNTVAEEILEKTFIKVWKDIHEYRAAKEGFLTWLLNMARTMSIEHLREYLKTQESQHSSGEEANSANKAVVELDTKQVEAIDMIFLKGYSYAEAAKFLQVPVETVKNRVKTAMQLLRKQS